MEVYGALGFVQSARRDIFLPYFGGMQTNSCRITTMESGNFSRRNYINSSRKEYFIRGYVVSDDYTDLALSASLSNRLLSRLRALCDHADELPEEIFNHYAEYTNLDPNVNLSNIRVWESLICPEMERYVRYDGDLESADRNPHVMRRNRIDTIASDDILRVLNEAGFHSDSDYVEKGFMFRKGAIKVTFTDTVSHEGGEPLLAPLDVELSVVAAPGQEDLVDTMKAFSEQFKPLVRWI